MKIKFLINIINIKKITMLDNTEKITKKTRILNFKTLNSTNHADIKIYLNKFFNDPSYYFKDELNDNYLIFNKVIKKHPSNYIIPINIKSINISSPKKKLTHMAVTKKNNLQVSRHQSLSEGSFVDKKKNLFSSNQSNLKNGQIYITDNEIDEIFNSFKLLQIKNSKNNSSNNILQKKINVFNKMNSFYRKFKKSRNDINTELLKNINVNYNKNNDKHIKNQKKNIKNTSNIDFNKTITTTYTNYNNKINTNTSRKKSDNLKSIKSQIQYCKSQKIYFNKEIQRNNLIEKQNQFLSTFSLPNSPNKVGQKHCAELLSRQEEVLFKQKENVLEENDMRKFLSKKINKEMNNLLMVSFKDNNLKDIFENKYREMMRNLYPERLYNWRKELRGADNFIKTFRSKNKTEEEVKNIADDDDIEKKFNINKSVKKYLKAKLPLKKYLFLNKYINEIRKKKEKIKSLSIEGSSLLNFEYQHIKNNLKGKKILNKYENFFTSGDINEKLCAKNAMMNIFHEKPFHSKKYLSI